MPAMLSARSFGLILPGLLLAVGVGLTARLLHGLLPHAVGVAVGVALLTGVALGVAVNVGLTVGDTVGLPLG